MAYEKIGVRQLRKDLSGVLSSVERNQQRLIIGKNTDEVAAIVPICDLNALDELDEKRAESVKNSVLNRDMATETGTEHESLDSMFSGFKEQEVDESRYEDEVIPDEVMGLDISHEQAFEFSPSENERSVAAALDELSPRTRNLFGNIYKMIDEAVLQKSEQATELYNGIAAILADEEVLSSSFVATRNVVMAGQTRHYNLKKNAALCHGVLTEIAYSGLKKHGISIADIGTSIGTNTFFKKD